MNYKCCKINSPELRLSNPFDIIVNINKNELCIQNRLHKANDPKKRGNLKK